MAKKSMMVKAARPQKFMVRQYNRCMICGRSRAYYRQFKLCRICLRTQALKGNIPGMIKSSW
ncbi:MAG TPA: type Z 30S ribosomal protein S14 [Desulfomonilaceae bacterium]|nr:type Z 30S ribosomal protein S14 [Desulfomonilaceae bacterium]